MPGPLVALHRTFSVRVLSVAVAGALVLLATTVGVGVAFASGDVAGAPTETVGTDGPAIESSADAIDPSTGSRGATDRSTASEQTAVSAACTAGEEYPEPGEDVYLTAADSVDADRYRFDRNGNGTWDTTFSSDDFVFFSYNEGTYSPRVQVVNDTTEETDTASCGTLEVGGNTPPTADIVANQTTIRPGETVAFDASGSTDDDGTIRRYAWDFDGDGNREIFEGQATQTYQYDTTGTYNVTVTAYDDDTAEDDAHVVIEVRRPEPTARCTVDPSEASIGNEVTIDARESSDADLYRYDFDGDGTTDRVTTASSVTYSYSSECVYDASVTVVDDDDLTATASRTLEVYRDPVAPTPRCTVSPTAVRPGESVTVDASDSENTVFVEFDVDGDASDLRDRVSKDLREAGLPAFGPRVADLTVTDTFGVQTSDVDASVEASDDWGLFTFDLSNHDEPGLFLPPVVGTSQTSETVEDVLFGRDEVANLVFGIESVVEGSLGDPLERDQFRLPAVEVEDVSVADSDRSGQVAADTESVAFHNPGDAPLDCEGWTLFAQHSNFDQPASAANAEILDLGGVELPPESTVRVVTSGDAALDTDDSVHLEEHAPVLASDRVLSVTRPGDGGGDVLVTIVPVDPDRLEEYPHYTLVNEVDDHWFPYVPSKTNGTHRFDLGLLLDQDALSGGPDAIPTPRGRLLDPDASIYDEEIPRGGRRVTRAYRSSAWLDGATHVWSSREARPGVGEVASGLRFDFLTNDGDDEGETDEQEA